MTALPIEIDAVCAVALCGRWATLVAIDRDGKPRPTCESHAPMIEKMAGPPEGSRCSSASEVAS